MRASNLKPRDYCIQLKISPAVREDAWELCRVVLKHGGVEVSDCCFTFVNKERWLAAVEALRTGFGPEYFEAADAAETDHGCGEIKMPEYRHLELLCRGPVSRVRILNHGPFCDERIAALASEWNSIADRADCRALIVDCSNVRALRSEMLSKLILLQRRLKQKEATLVLSGLHTEAREVLSWTRLDRFFTIEEDAEREVCVSASGIRLCVNS